MAAKLVDRFKSGKEHFLRHFCGFVIVTQKTIDQVESRPLVPPHENFKRAGVAGLDALDAIGVTHPVSKHRLRLY